MSIYRYPRSPFHSFVNLKHPRLNALIYPFVSRINLSQAPNQWLQEYLSHIQPLTTAIQLDDDQLDVIFPEAVLDVYPQLQSVFLCNIPDENAKCFLYLETFKTQLSVLKMVLTDYDVQTPEPHYSTLFRSDCSLQTLLL
ncbi:unnamed protein product, partial [Didymodactylos carnosus]